MAFPALCLPCFLESCSNSLALFPGKAARFYKGTANLAGSRHKSGCNIPALPALSADTYSNACKPSKVFSLGLSAPSEAVGEINSFRDDSSPPSGDSRYMKDLKSFSFLTLPELQVSKTHKTHANLFSSLICLLSLSQLIQGTPSSRCSPNAALLFPSPSRGNILCTYLARWLLKIGTPNPVLSSG